MEGKVVVTKFKFFILKLWELARLSAAVACVYLVFSPKKLNSNEAFNVAFSY